MVKTRLIPVLYIKNGLIVRSEGFSYHQLIGNIYNEAHRYNEWNVDELIYIDISRTSDYDLRRDDHKVQPYTNIKDIMKIISETCFMPLTFGGGIRNMKQIEFYISHGADKIVLNTGAIENIQLIKEASLKYGSQAVVLSIDYKVIDNEPIVFSKFGQNNTGLNLYNWIKKAEENGIGEIFLNSIDRDGKANGYDLEIIDKALSYTKLPVIACGGAGTIYDFVELANKTKVSGIAAGNWFHFVERSYPKAKEFLKKNKINVR